MQALTLLYHNFPGQRTLVVAHSNQALNDVFQKTIERDVPPRYLLRLGMGQEELATDVDFSRTGAQPPNRPWSALFCSVKLGELSFRRRACSTLTLNSRAPVRVPHDLASWMLFGGAGHGSMLTLRVPHRVSQTSRMSILLFAKPPQVPPRPPESTAWRPCGEHKRAGHHQRTCNMSGAEPHTALFGGCVCSASVTGFISYGILVNKAFGNLLRNHGDLTESGDAMQGA